MSLSALPHLAFKFYSTSLIGKLAYTVLVLNCFQDSVLHFTMDCENTVSVFVLMLIPDFRSFKGWQKNAITAYLGELSIKIGKPNDFI
ncbi:hypothetical protein Gotur_029887 [Gossypium turneri]